MKIYHTETQADYDALMIKLEEEGVVWVSWRKPTESKDWNDRKENTCVKILDKKATRGSISFFKEDYPNIPITKYTAEGEKMRFTKENAWHEMEKWLNGPHTTQKELRDRINELDDTPEKVVVPKFVAEFYEKRKHYILSVIFDEFKRSEERKVADWYIDGRSGGRHVNGLANSQETIAKMHLHGYTIEEPQYIVSIMDLGIDRIILIKNKLGYSFELESENDGYWEVHFTEQQIKECDKRYWAFAVPVE